MFPWFDWASHGNRTLENTESSAPTISAEVCCFRGTVSGNFVVGQSIIRMYLFPNLATGNDSIKSITSLQKGSENIRTSMRGAFFFSFGFPILWQTSLLLTKVSTSLKQYGQQNLRNTHPLVFFSRRWPSQLWLWARPKISSLYFDRTSAWRNARRFYQFPAECVATKEKSNILLDTPSRTVSCMLERLGSTFCSQMSSSFVTQAGEPNVLVTGERTEFSTSSWSRWISSSSSFRFVGSAVSELKFLNYCSL